MPSDRLSQRAAASVSRAYEEKGAHDNLVDSAAIDERTLIADPIVTNLVMYGTATLPIRSSRGSPRGRSISGLGC
jgi:hypothetical protein